ncbi:hypothetical protein [Nocardia sputi]|uniref:hypothetical protein n=1 Tax=Nocardia sputi TaxID=2943705 RepID=UPI0020BF5189|nr:hypothetical protein [Nocardia sputi]
MSNQSETTKGQAQPCIPQGSDYRRQLNNLWLDGSISPEADIDTNNHAVLDNIPD